MLGRGSKYASVCREESYIGAGFEIYQNPIDEISVE